MIQSVCSMSVFSQECIVYLFSRMTWLVYFVSDFELLWILIVQGWMCDSVSMCGWCVKCIVCVSTYFSSVLMVCPIILCGAITNVELHVIATMVTSSKKKTTTTTKLMIILFEVYFFLFWGGMYYEWYNSLITISWFENLK